MHSNCEDSPDGSLFTSTWFWSVFIVQSISQEQINRELHRFFMLCFLLISKCHFILPLCQPVHWRTHDSKETGTHLQEQTVLYRNTLETLVLGTFFFSRSYFSYTQVRSQYGDMPWLRKKWEWINGSGFDMWGDFIFFVNQFYQINQILWLDPIGIWYHVKCVVMNPTLH